MREFIIKKFVKDYENVKDSAVRERYGSVAGIAGIISNIIICTFKILIGVIFGSIAVLADGINNLADAASSVITLIGFKLAARKPSKDHPYGHGRTEYLAGLVVSVMIIVIGVQLLRSSIDKTIHPQPMEFSILTIVVLAASIAIKLWQTGFNMHIGKLINSDALLATGADSRNDVISTSVVLLSIIIGRVFNINIDGPMGILVALFILWSGVGLVKETIAPIMGKAPEKETVGELSRLIISDPLILGIHDLIIHDYGPGRLFASVHVEVDGEGDIYEIHDTVDNIEVRALDEMGILLTIHMDPVKVGDPLTDLVKEQLYDVSKAVGGIINVHDVRVVSGPTHINVVFDAVTSYDNQRSSEDIKADFSARMKELDPKYICVINLDRPYI